MLFISFIECVARRWLFKMRHSSVTVCVDKDRPRYYFQLSTCVRQIPAPITERAPTTQASASPARVRYPLPAPPVKQVFILFYHTTAVRRWPLYWQRVRYVIFLLETEMWLCEYRPTVALPDHGIM